MQDYSYGQAYADWQSELRAAAAAPADRRDRRSTTRASGQLRRPRPALVAWKRALRVLSPVGR